MHYCFDVDGTLIESFDFDAEAYAEAVHKTLGIEVDDNWDGYRNVSDAGILKEFITRIGRAREWPQLQQQVKQRFLNDIANRLQDQSIVSVRGAKQLLSTLRNRQASISIATGAWAGSAKLKLASAGIDIRGIPFASSDDHEQRDQIMLAAIERAGVSSLDDVIYFGDGIWDKQTCEALGVKFVLVGSRCQHQPAIEDFSTISDLPEFVAALRF